METKQFYLRVPEDLNRLYRAKCESEGLKPASVARQLMGAYARGQILLSTAVVGPPTPTHNLEDVLR